MGHNSIIDAYSCKIIFFILIQNFIVGFGSYTNCNNLNLKNIRAVYSQALGFGWLYSSDSVFESSGEPLTMVEGHIEFALDGLPSGRLIGKRDSFCVNGDGGS